MCSGKKKKNLRVCKMAVLMDFDLYTNILFKCYFALHGSIWNSEDMCEPCNKNNLAFMRDTFLLVRKFAVSAAKRRSCLIKVVLLFQFFGCCGFLFVVGCRCFGNSCSRQRPWSLRKYFSNCSNLCWGFCMLEQNKVSYRTTLWIW